MLLKSKSAIEHRQNHAEPQHATRLTDLLVGFRRGLVSNTIRVNLDISGLSFSIE